MPFPLVAVRVAAPMALSGPLAALGRQAAQGLTLWAEQAGAELELVDDGSRASRAAEVLRHLQADWLVGPYGSATTLAAARAAAALGRVLWNHGGASDAIVGPHVVSVLSPASRYLAGVADLLPSPVVIRYNPVGTFATEVLRGLQGGIRVPFGVPAPRAEGLVLVGRYPQEVELLRSLDYRPAAIVAVSAGVRQFGLDLGDAAEGVMGPSQWVASESDPFARDYEARFGCAPDYPAASAYALGQVLEHLAQESRHERDMLRAARPADFETFYGRFKLDADGRQMGHAVRLVRWEKGRQVVLR